MDEDVTVVDAPPTLAPKPGARLAIAEEGGGRREADCCCCCADKGGGGCCKPNPPAPGASEGATLLSNPATLDGLPAAPLAAPPGAIPTAWWGQLRSL